jgi:hypothetical protein
MLTNTHALAWSGEKDQQGQHKPRPRLAMSRFLQFQYGLNLT